MPSHKLRTPRHLDTPSTFTTATWRVIVGVAGGLCFAAVFAVFAAVARLLDGADAFDTKVGIPLQALVSAYAVGCAAGGVVVGLLHPLRRNRYGAMVVTALAVMPFYVAVFYAMQGSKKFDILEAWLIVGIGCAMGLFGSRLLRIDPGDKSTE